jgi:hypothetical protein
LSPSTVPRKCEPKRPYFQITASAKITRTTTRLITVSWNIA